MPSAGFVAGPPGSGGAVLAAALARAAGVWHGPGRGYFLAGTSVDTDMARDGWRSHALRAEQAAGREAQLRDAVADRLRDREHRPAPDGDPAGTAVLWSARSALRVGFLDAVFPGCRFVMCVRDPAGATEEIGTRIEVIQGDTGRAVIAIRDISTIITRINDIQTGIAGAVEAQCATTSELVRNSSDAA